MNLRLLVIGHISGVPIEELLLPLVYGAGAIWATARVVAARSRNLRKGSAR